MSSIVPWPRIDLSRILFLLAMLINLGDREGCLGLAIQQTSLLSNCHISRIRTKSARVVLTAGVSELTTNRSVAVGIYLPACWYTFAGEAAMATLMSSKCSTVALSGPDKSLSDVSPRIWILCWRQNKQGHALCLSNLRAWTRLPFVWSSIVSSAWEFLLHLVLSMK